MQLKSILKRPAYLGLSVFSYTSDLYRYIRNASVLFLSDSERKLEALIRKDNHRIEKGLALPAPRIWFGEPVLRRLSRNLSAYQRFKNADTSVFQESSTVVNAYTRFFSGKSTPPALIQQHLDTLSGMLKDQPQMSAGIFELRKDEVLRHLDIDYASFVKSRFSVRNFTGETVPSNTIEAAIELACKTPSVCNRCAWKTYVVSSQPMLGQVLACQNGNAGFGNTCGNVLIVAMDLRCFEGAGERNQAYVDGGLFAMSLVYALHSMGVASCFLNWSTDLIQDARLRKLLDIPSHEVVITFIGIGVYPEKINVAISPRPSAEDVLIEK